MPLEHPYEPVDLQKVQQVFPADALDYMPAMEDIPEPWSRLNYRDEWPCDLTTDIIFCGLDDIQLIPQDGSWGQEDVNRAFTHVVTVARSFAPKHEHKEAAMRFLLDRWFSHARWKRKDDDEWTGDWPEELENASTEDAEEARKHTCTCGHTPGEHADTAEAPCELCDCEMLHYLCSCPSTQGS